MLRIAEGRDARLVGMPLIIRPGRLPQPNRRFTSSAGRAEFSVISYQIFHKRAPLCLNPGKLNADG